MAPTKFSASEEREAGKKRNPDTNPMKDVSWAGIFSQHETNMNAHLEIIGMVKNHVAEGSDAFSTICGMVDRTNELMRQLEVVRKEFLPSRTANMIFGLGPGGGRKRMAADIEPEDTASRPRSSRKGETGSMNGRTGDGNGQLNEGQPSFVFDSKPTPTNPPERPKSRKRSRGEEAKPTLDEIPTPPAGKRTKIKSSSRSSGKTKSPTETTATTPPNPVETEDISAEVEARLKIREASRQRKDERKRKRESMNSDVGEGSAASTRKPKKKKTKKSEGGSGVESTGDEASRKAEKKEKRRKRET